MDFWVALIIIAAVMAGFIIAALLIYKSQEAMRKSDATKSLPQGGDSSDIARMLQDKYRAERDNGDIQRPEFF